jgi:hypothetical protein
MHVTFHMILNVNAKTERNKQHRGLRKRAKSCNGSQQTDYLGYCNDTDRRTKCKGYAVQKTWCQQSLHIHRVISTVDSTNKHLSYLYIFHEEHRVDVRTFNGHTILKKKYNNNERILNLQPCFGDTIFELLITGR